MNAGFRWRSRFGAASALAVLLGTYAAIQSWWISDDAFISFRYALNLVEGNGLVFNVGERVEAYTNFLWTLWVAAGLAAGCRAETWANLTGIAFYLASILLLAANQRAVTRRMEPLGCALPVAALGAALHQDWAAFATGGLETSMFTFLLLCGFLIVVWGRTETIALVCGGLVFALASLTRPDGILPAFAVGVFILATGRPRLKSASVYALSFAAIWVPFIAWRILYYGEVVPNSYYAKSANLAWYEQGLRYLQLYLERYWIVLLGPVLLMIAPLFPKNVSREPRRQIILAAAIALPYAFYIVRVGGDFMFARMLIPITPFLLIILEMSWYGLFRWRQDVAWGAAVLILTSIYFSPPPVTGIVWRYGIANEPMYYSGEIVGQMDRASGVLRKYFHDLPVRVAFYGAEARLVYKARFSTAIEGETGLTDPAVAKRPLIERGRVGHEKPPSVQYLVLDRKADFTFSRVPQDTIGLLNEIPDVRVKFDEEVYGQVLHWNPPLLDALRRQGAIVPDFPSFLDSYIAQIERIPGSTVAADFKRFTLFYFAHVDDPFRRSAFQRRLASPAP